MKKKMPPQKKGMHGKKEMPGKKPESMSAAKMAKHMKKKGGY